MIGRRPFLKKVACALIGTGLMLAPVAAGLILFLDPLRRKSAHRGFVRLTTVDSLPLGVPRRFTILGSRQDAWNTYSNVPIGAVYLIRRERHVDALQVICPHAGCFVEFNSEKREFHCPCHRSSFHLDGSVADPNSPSPRGLDKLDVEIRGTDVLVRYEEFRQSTKEKIAIS